MFNDKEKMRKRPCVVLKRCSGMAQVGTSMVNQSRSTDQIVADLEMPAVGVMDLEGVSGSIPGNRTDIDELIRRKKERNDFEVLVIQDATRFTRAGQGHGQKLLFDLRAEGILVYFVAEDLLVDSEMSATFASLLFTAAHHAVLMLAYNTVNGSTVSYLSGRSPYTKRPPFGLDRMYSLDGVDLHIIRNLPDGTQAQLDPKTFAVIRRYGKNTRKGVPQHYIKQKNEAVRLVTGELKLITVVHMMFRMWLVEGKTFVEIARYLNDNDIPSARGKEWHSANVRKILLNPIYIGLGIRGRTSRSIYWEPSDKSPQRSEVSFTEIVKNKHLKLRMRPRSKWLERVQPHLTEFLPEETRPLATERISAHLDSIASGKSPKPNRDRHKKSTFWLKKWLVSKQGGYPMTGRVGGSKNDIRSYGVARGISVPKTDNVLANRVQAGPMESTVAEMFRQVVLNRPALVDAIKRIVAQEMGQKKDDSGNVDALVRERNRKRKQLGVLSDDVSLDEDDALTRKITAIKTDIRSLDQRIAAASVQIPQEPVDVTAVAERLAAEFEQFGRDFDKQDLPRVEQVVGILINKKIEVDLVTKEFELEFSLPSWMGRILASRGAVGLDELLACKTFMEAHTENRLILGQFHCDGAGKPVCYTCQRMKWAA